jgi:rod shape-determining protein MreC
MGIKNFSTFFLIFFLIFLILLLNFFSKPVRNFFYLISTPFQKFFWQAGKKISDFVFGIFKASSLKKENERLNLEIQNLLQQISFLEEVKRENQMLREALGVGLGKEYKIVLANVIGKEAAPNLFRLDKGKKDGVEKGKPVINEAKSLCGRIFEVYDNFSQFQLPSDKNFSFAVKIAGKEGIFLAKGLGDSKILLDLIPKEISIEVGDLVITSAQEGFFPNGLFVGKIESIEKSDLEPFQKAKVNLACQVEKAEFLFIIKEW